MAPGRRRARCTPRRLRQLPRFADGEVRRALVRDVEPGRRLAFTWWPLTGVDVGRSTSVTITIEPTGAGSRLRLVETRARAGGCRRGRMSAHDRRLGAVFSALADPARRRLLGRLAEQQSATATELAAAEPVSRQAIVKHLQSLDEAGLVSPSRAGREVRYALTPRPPRGRRDGWRPWAPNGTSVWPGWRSSQPANNPIEGW